MSFKNNTCVVFFYCIVAQIKIVIIIEVNETNRLANNKHYSIKETAFKPIYTYNIPHKLIILLLSQLQT